MIAISEFASPGFVIRESRCSSQHAGRDLDEGPGPSRELRNLWILHPTSSHHIGVSKNRGIPKWMVYNGKTLLKWMIWGYHYFWKHPYPTSLFFNKQKPEQTIHFVQFGFTSICAQAIAPVSTQRNPINGRWCHHQRSGATIVKRMHCHW